MAIKVSKRYRATDCSSEATGKYRHSGLSAQAINPNRIDGFFPAKLLVEMKSDGKNLDDAYAQACS